MIERFKGKQDTDCTDEHGFRGLSISHILFYVRVKGEVMKHKPITDQILCSYYNVYNKLGYGFLEKVYENALLIELKKSGVVAEAQCPINVFYNGEIVGEYFTDLLVEGKVIVEIKATKNLVARHEAQLLNYLKATDSEVGLLLNFGPKAEVNRKVFDNHKK
jgi:GxxExxY protein